MRKYSPLETSLAVALVLGVATLVLYRWVSDLADLGGVVRTVQEDVREHTRRLDRIEQRAKDEARDRKEAAAREERIRGRKDLTRALTEAVRERCTPTASPPAP